MSRPLAVAALVLSIAQVAPAQSQSDTGQETGSLTQTPPPETPPATLPPPASVAAPQEPAVPWTRRLYSWASVGTTFAYGQTYGSANVGAGLMMKYGIAPNVEVGYAFGNTPNIWSLRPGVTWYMPVSQVRPYVGTYYTHWFVGDNFPDQDGIGARAGFSIGRVISLGVTYDHAIGCSRNCDIWTPQISAGLSL